MNRKKEEADHDLRYDMILRASKLLGYRQTRYDDLPQAVKDLFCHFSYMDIIRPLIELKRKEGASYEQIAIHFRITKSAVEWHFKRTIYKKNH